MPTPFFVCSMTAGLGAAGAINRVLARACASRGWAMGVGSQRRQLLSSEFGQECSNLRREAEGVQLFGNIGISQVIHSSVGEIRRLVDSLQADAMVVHTNPLQECLQPEGTPQFKGGVEALERLGREIGVPLILKETGCGFSKSTLALLKDIGLAAVDVSGFGGTHWGRLEGKRSETGHRLNRASEIFADWGTNTVESVLNAVELKPPWEIWASGGVRSGLDAAKFLAMGAHAVGVAKPLLQEALKGEKAVTELMENFEFELKMSMFCTGSRDIQSLQKRGVWTRDDLV